MCGIFGLLKSKDSDVSGSDFRALLNDLFELSESRGKEAAGLALRDTNSINIYKQPICATQMIRQSDYLDLLDQIDYNRDVCALGHSRLVTNGSQFNISK